MGGDYPKPVPVPDADTQEFWDGCKGHELRAQRCTACGTWRWPPQGICPMCYSWDFEWVKLPETGQIYSYVVVHHDTSAFASEVPYVMANIVVDGTAGRVRLRSNVVGRPWTDVRVGMRVRVFFDDVTPNLSLPKFTVVD